MGENSKIFVLGVGAQKCGTSWVHDYLASMPLSNFGFNKEYHIFDALHINACKCFHDLEHTAVIAGRTENPARYHSAVQRLAFLENPQLYYSYFTDLLNDDSVSITGDFTPSYSGLPIGVLSKIKKEFGSRGVKVIPVFLMRDPVKRIHSMARMSLRRSKKNFNLNDEIRVIKQLHLSPQDVFRSDYKSTLHNLDSVFGDEYFVGFYESIFTHEETERLVEMLEIGYIPPDFSRKVNQGNASNDLPADLVIELRDGYKGTYDFCIERFGVGKISKYWP